MILRGPSPLLCYPTLSVANACRGWCINCLILSYTGCGRWCVCMCGCAWCSQSVRQFKVGNVHMAFLYAFNIAILPWRIDAFVHCNSHDPCMVPAGMSARVCVYVHKNTHIDRGSYMVVGRNFALGINLIRPAWFGFLSIWSRYFYESLLQKLPKWYHFNIWNVSLLATTGRSSFYWRF